MHRIFTKIVLKVFIFRLKIMKKKLICLLMSCIYLSVADDYKVDVSKLMFDNKVKNLNISGFSPMADGSILGARFSKGEVYLYKILPDGKFVSLGTVPHPDINELRNDMRVAFASNSAGTIFVKYRFYNSEQKDQFVFYTLKNNQWTRLPDYTMNTNVDKLYLDNNDQAYFKTSSSTFYGLDNGSWELIKNAANDPKSEMQREDVYAVADNWVYSSRSQVSNGEKIFNIYRYGKDKVELTDNITPEAGYVPICETNLNNGKIMVAYANNHQNLTKQSLKFQVVELSKYASYPYQNGRNTSAIGSLFGLVSAVIDLGAALTGQSNNKVYVTDVGNEIDLNPYIYTATTGSEFTRSTVSCTTVGNTSYFIANTNISPYNPLGRGKPQYIYFKVTQTK